MFAYILSCVFGREERGLKLQKLFKFMFEDDEFDKE